MSDATQTIDPADRAFLAAFEAATIAPGDFDHRAHVRAAWLYLRLHPDTARQRFVRTLVNFTTGAGAPEKYHETITRAWLQIIAARIDPAEDWPRFAARNPDLFDAPREVLARHYSEALIGSERARAKFVEPDRSPLPGYP